jgi:hypothetical protein
MLKNEVDHSIDLVEEKWRLEGFLPSDFLAFFTEDDDIHTFQYPALDFPTKVKSISFDKEQNIRGKLVGIKGQYLIFEGGIVLNLRKHTGYVIEFSVVE